MDGEWYYLERGKRQGPVDFPALLKALLSVPNPLTVRVWREGLSDWQPASAVRELAAKLPPPLPSVSAHTDPSTISRVEAAKTASLYRRLVLLVGAHYMVVFLLIPIVAIADSSTAGSSSIPLMLALATVFVIFVTTIATSHQLVSRLGASQPLLWSLGMLVPWINLVVIWKVSSLATAWCRRFGIQMGFLGPTKASLAQLRAD